MHAERAVRASRVASKYDEQWLDICMQNVRCEQVGLRWIIAVQIRLVRST